MKQCAQAFGFTLVELVAGMATASVLALTAGTILQIGYTGWIRNRAAIDVQRDGTVVMDLLSRTIRQASATNVTVAATEIEVGTPDGAVGFVADGNDLKRYSVVGGVSSERVIVDERLTSIQFTLVDDQGIAIVLQLREEDESSRTRGFFAFRN